MVWKNSSFLIFFKKGGSPFRIKDWILRMFVHFWRKLFSELTVISGSYNLDCFNTIVTAQVFYTKTAEEYWLCFLLYLLWIKKVFEDLHTFWMWFKYCLVAERWGEPFLNDVVSNKQLSIKSWVFVVCVCSTCISKVVS